ncbi:MAG: filamentous hemagglutinin N-terminal domain-containing protein, partial [Phycisphaerae bacterium]|nr:filamentous hemagglutinin N-terminal domain-containing protein [Phycisphaerae bacterium]
MTRRLLAVFLAWCMVIYPLQLRASGPTDPTVVSGTATFAHQGSNLTVTTSNNVIINWGSFNVAQGSTVRFVQPSVSSLAVNRVVGPSASYINGLLTANGRLILLNPNGITVGPTGVVRASGFIASTMHLSNEQIITGGDMHFMGNSDAAIVNRGKIEALGGDVMLIARKVSNSGTIRAPGGKVSLVAAVDVMLTEDGKLFVQPAGLTNRKLDIGVNNTGLIEAAQVELQTRDGNLYALAINNGGVIRATGFTTALAGRVLLRGEGGAVVDTGSIIAKSVTPDGKTVGGEIQVLGQTVELSGNAVLDASGELGGGAINIGGSFQGLGPLLNAEHTTVGSGVTLNADAFEYGDGGTVILWGDKSTSFDGSIYARGGQGGGDGGFAEISGVESLDFTGNVDLSAAAGQNGTVLLDPTNFDINGFWAGTIIVLLATNNVVVSTSPVGGEHGDISVNSGIQWWTDNSLSLLAHGDINVNDGLQCHRGGDLNLVAGWDGSTGWPGAHGIRTGVVDMAAIFADANSYGNSNGRVRFQHPGFWGFTISAGSRHGATQVATYDLDISAGGSPFSSCRLGYLSGGSAATGAINVRVKNDLTLAGGNGLFSSYAQIGHGGLTIPGDFSGAIDVQVGGDLAITSGSGLIVYAMIGHGDWDIAGGNRQGDISVRADGQMLLGDATHTNWWIGHRTWAGGISNADVSIHAGGLAVNGTGPTSGNVDVNTIAMRDMLLANLVGGDVTLGALGPAGHNGVLTNHIDFNYDSPNALNFESTRHIRLNNDITNAGSGAFTLQAGRNVNLNATVTLGGAFVSDSGRRFRSGNVFADTITINAGQTGNGSDNVFGVLSAANGIAINGGAGDDSFDFTGLIFAGVGNVVVDGGAGFDDLAFNVPDAIDLLAVNYTNANDGWLEFFQGLTSRQYDYLAFEPLLINAGSITDVVFDLPNTRDIAALANAAAPGFMSLNSLNGTFENTVFLNPTNSLRINCRRGDDILTVNSMDPGFNADFSLYGNRGDDLLRILGLGASFTSALRVYGNRGYDIIDAANLGGPGQRMALTYFDAERINLQNVYTTGRQTYIGPDWISLNGRLDTTGGRVRINGPTWLEGDSVVRTAGGNIRINGTVGTIGGPHALTLNAGGIGGGNVTVTGSVGSGPGNALSRLIARGRRLSFQDVTTRGRQSYTGNWLAFGGDLTSWFGSVLMDSQNGVDFNHVLQAGGLRLAGNGTFRLNNAANDINRLAANVNGRIFYRDVNGFNIGTVGGVNGVTASRLVRLNSGGLVTQTQPLRTRRLLLRGSGDYRLGSEANDVNVLAARTTGNWLAYRDTDDFRIGRVRGVSGITTNPGGLVALITDGGLVRQGSQAPINTGELALIGWGDFRLNNRNNDIDTLMALVGGNVFYRDANSFGVGRAVGNLPFGLGIGALALGNVRLRAPGTITFRQPSACLFGNMNVRAGEDVVVQGLTGASVASILGYTRVRAGRDVLLGGGGISVLFGGQGMDIIGNRNVEVRGGTLIATGGCLAEAFGLPSGDLNILARNGDFILNESGGLGPFTMNILATNGGDMSIYTGGDFIADGPNSMFVTCRIFDGQQFFPPGPGGMVDFNAAGNVYLGTPIMTCCGDVFVTA